MGQTGKTDIVTTIDQAKTEFNYADGVRTDTPVIQEGKVTANNMTAGSWTGNFYFNINCSPRAEQYFDVTSQLDFMNNKMMNDSTMLENNSNYSTAVVKVEAGEKYRITGLSGIYSRLYTLKATLTASENMGMYPAKGVVEGDTLYKNIEVTIPNGCNYLVLSSKTAGLPNFKLEKQNSKVIETYSDDFYWDYGGKQYAVFTFDDSTTNTDQIVDLFAKYNVPACYATIPENLNNMSSNGTETIKQVLTRAQNSGSEILSHSFATLSASATDADYQKGYCTDRTTLEANGFTVNGHITAGGADDQDFNKSEKWAKEAGYLYADYSAWDNLFDQRYRNPRQGMDSGVATTESYINNDATNPLGKCTFLYSHANRPISEYEEIIKYCLDNNIEIVTWNTLYNTCGRTR